MIDVDLKSLNRWFVKQHEFRVRVNGRPAGV